MNDITGVSYLYVRDRKNPKRVLTVARIVEGDTIKFAYCVNRVSDTFKKDVGRSISSGRLAKSESAGKYYFETERYEDEPPVATAVEVLMEFATDPIVKRMAYDYVMEPHNRKPVKKRRLPNSVFVF